MHEGEDVVEEVLPLGALGQFVQLQERGEEKAFVQFSREIIKIMSGALSTKGGKEGRRDATQIIRLTSDGTPGIFDTRTRGKGAFGRAGGRAGASGLTAAAPFSDALIFIGGAEGAIRYYDRE